MLAGFFAIAKIMLTQASKDRDADREERKEFIKVINKMGDGMTKVAESNKEIANETKLGRKVQEKGFGEAEKRNGHLAELIQQGTEQTQVIADKAVEVIVSTVQHVDKQEVEHQHVKEKD